MKINSILALDKMHKIAEERNFFEPDENSIVYIDQGSSRDGKKKK